MPLQLRTFILLLTPHDTKRDVVDLAGAVSILDHQIQRHEHQPISGEGDLAPSIRRRQIRDRIIYRLCRSYPIFVVPVQNHVTLFFSQTNKIGTGRMFELPYIVVAAEGSLKSILTDNVAQLMKENRHYGIDRKSVV